MAAIKEKDLPAASGIQKNDYIRTVDNDGTSKKTAVSYLLSLFYPIGSYYETSDTSFDPNTAWGGTWSLEAEGKVHIGSGSNYAVGSTGGAKEVTLTEQQIPSHNHVVNYVYYNRGTGSSTTMGYISPSDQPNNATTSNTGGGQAHNNMPPYVVVNRWHRTA